MRKLFLITGLCAALGISSCLKDNSGSTPTVDCSTIATAAPSSEIFPLKTYLEDSGINAVQDYRGFFYTMDSTAVPDSITNRAKVCSSVAVTYKGYFENGHGFDSSVTPVSFPLSTAITGWQEALPLMKKGATMTLYLPPSLAYGSAGSTGSPQVIPPNTPIIFTIKLYDYQ